MAVDDPRQSLARRLRALREQHWPGVAITQQQLAQALGGVRRLSISLISSWENTGAIPPERRLEAYATFFATFRSVEMEPYRVLMLSQLDENERTAREELLLELRQLRRKAIATEPGAQAAPMTMSDSGFWHFDDPNNIVTIVCAGLPQKLKEKFGDYANPVSPDYVALYTYADPDSLIELYGHVRAANPTTQVYFKTVQELVTDDYTSHLVLLGGVDWNLVTRDLLERTGSPVRQVARHKESDIGGFEVLQQDGSTELFAPQLDSNGQLILDVAHFYHGPNPFNSKRTVTICNGMYGRGTLGVVRALTDARFRDRNDTFLTSHFNNASAFSIITRVAVVMGEVLTPDWTQPETRMHEWVEPRE